MPVRIKSVCRAVRGVGRAHGRVGTRNSHPCTTECVLLGLRDCGLEQERWARRRAARASLPGAFGNFLASLAPWSWFINPITFRGDAPCSDGAMKNIGEWLADLQAQAGGSQVGWVVAEEFGALGGRWHCHGLVCGVSHLSRRFWWAEAFRRFGRTTIEPFDPARAGAFYAAKYAAKALGKIHFGGTLAGVELSRVVQEVIVLAPKYATEHGSPLGTEFGRVARRVKVTEGAKLVKRAWVDSLTKSPEPVSTHAVIAPSAGVERSFFRLGLRRWHR